jgi:hypothetical protein
MNLLASVPPNVISPFVSDAWVLGSNDKENISCGLTPWLKRLSVTVGIVPPELDVPLERSTGPKPSTPSTPLKP